MKIILIIVFSLIFWSCNSQNNQQREKFIGHWVGDIKNPQTGKQIGKLYVEYTKNGECFVTSRDEKEEVVSKMNYKVRGNTIFYKSQTSDLAYESTYYFKGDTLFGNTEGSKAYFVRVK